jgi:hypothetical protein
VILIAFAALAAWLVSLYVHPFTTCGRCRGRRVNRGSTRKRFGTCKGCAGTGRKQRFGSRTLHHWVRSAMTQYQRDRARRREQHVEEQTRNPRETGGRP